VPISLFEQSLRHRHVNELCSFVQTDMGNAGAKAVGLEKAFQTVEESVGGIVKTIDEGTRESIGAQFRVWDGSQFPW
jgi:norsolorinic acid ketoreductase